MIKYILILWVIILLFGCAKKETKIIERQNTNSNSTKLVLNYTQRQGKQTYTKYCQVCHGEQGRGDGFNAYNLTPKPRNFTDTIFMQKANEEHLIKVIRNGGKNSNLSSSMPLWGGRLSEREIEFVISYLRTFH